MRYFHKSKSIILQMVRLREPSSSQALAGTRPGLEQSPSVLCAISLAAHIAGRDLQEYLQKGRVFIAALQCQ